MTKDDTEMDQGLEFLARSWTNSLESKVLWNCNDISQIISEEHQVNKGLSGYQGFRLNSGLRMPSVCAGRWEHPTCIVVS